MDFAPHATIGSHVGADDLHMPGGAQRLRGAAEQITGLADRLAEVADALDGVRAAREDRGFATRALGGLRRRTVESLREDARQLRRLGEAAQQEADLLGEVQGSRLEEMRQRWRQAKQHLAAAAEASEHRRQARFLVAEDGGGHGGGHGGGGGRGRGAELRGLGFEGGGRDEPPVDGLALARGIEADIVQEHAGLWQRLFGWTPTEPGGGGGAFLTEQDSELDVAMTAFRQTVRQVMSEWADYARRLEDLDRTVEHRVDREAVLVAHVVDDDGPDMTMVSDPEALRSMSRELADHSRGIRQALHQIESIGADLAQGRMQPQEDRGRENHRFERQWSEHLEDLADRFRPVSERAEELAEEMLRLDREGARQLRSLVRD